MAKGTEIKCQPPILASGTCPPQQTFRHSPAQHVWSATHPGLAPNPPSPSQGPASRPSRRCCKPRASRSRRWRRCCHTWPPPPAWASAPARPTCPRSPPGCVPAPWAALGRAKVGPVGSPKKNNLATILEVFTSFSPACCCRPNSFPPFWPRPASSRLCFFSR